ncbi:MULTISPECIES: hypothetical protein [Streptomyces]|uniref:hypothetical protein n=1 Tax=Streptomyces TaxID=1883 RepID=UPI0033EEE268
MRLTIIWEPAAAAGLRRLKSRDGDAVKPLVQAINSLALQPEPPESSKLGGTICGGYGWVRTESRTRSMAHEWRSRC